MRKDSNDRRFTSRPHSNHFHLPQRAHEALSIWTGLYMWIYIYIYIYIERIYLFIRIDIQNIHLPIDIIISSLSYFRLIVVYQNVKCTDLCLYLSDIFHLFNMINISAYHTDESIWTHR